MNKSKKQQSTLRHALEPASQDVPAKSMAVRAESPSAPLTTPSAAMPDTPRQPELLRVQLSTLEPMKEQYGIYDECSEAEAETFANDIRRRGLERPIEVLPPTDRGGRQIYQIIDGNRRKKALAVIGTIETEVKVRWDLANASQAEIQIAFISANLMRRQLDTVQRVRAAIRQYEWLCANGKSLPASALLRAREEIGRLIGLSGRAVSRYLRLVRTPLVIQRAVSRGQLRLVVGERVADLLPALQEKIAARLEQAKDPKQFNELVTSLIPARTM